MFQHKEQNKYNCNAYVWSLFVIHIPQTPRTHGREPVLNLIHFHLLSVILACSATALGWFHSPFPVNQPWSFFRISLLSLVYPFQATWRFLLVFSNFQGPSSIDPFQHYLFSSLYPSSLRIAFGIALPLTSRLLKIARVSPPTPALCGKDALMESLWVQGNTSIPEWVDLIPGTWLVWACAWRCQAFRENIQNEDLVHLISGTCVRTCDMLPLTVVMATEDFSGFYSINLAFHVFCSHRVET